MDGESTAFLSQISEVDKALEDLAKSGKLYTPKGSTYPQQQQQSQFSSQANPGQSRYGATSHYASQRHPGPQGSREYGASRNMRSMHQGPQADYGASYYPPPPPLQQQYPHSQQQNTYPGRQSAMSTGSYETSSTFSNSGAHIGGSQYAASSSAARYDAPQLSYQQQGNRSFSPLGGTAALPPLSRLNTGSSHSTNPSISAGMSSSMSMLPPGYGRDEYSSGVPSSVHSRAHSVTGSANGVTHQQAGSFQHSRTQSISQLSDSGRTLSGSKVSTGSATTTGLFSPPLQGHSSAPSVSGSTNSPSPSAAAFNFFTGPTTQVHGSSSMQSSVTSNAGGSAAFPRIAPIGRPSHGKTSASDAFGGSRIGSKSNTGSNSAVTSGVTSPLSSGFSDGWLDSGSTSQQSNHANSEGQKRSVQSVWN